MKWTVSPTFTHALQLLWANGDASMLTSKKIGASTSPAVADKAIRVTWTSPKAVSSVMKLWSGIVANWDRTARCAPSQLEVNDPSISAATVRRLPRTWFTGMPKAVPWVSAGLQTIVAPSDCSMPVNTKVRGTPGKPMSAAVNVQVRPVGLGLQKPTVFRSDSPMSGALT